MGGGGEGHLVQNGGAMFRTLDTLVVRTEEGHVGGTRDETSALLTVDITLPVGTPIGGEGRTLLQLAKPILLDTQSVHALDGVLAGTGVFRGTETGGGDTPAVPTLELVLLTGQLHTLEGTLGTGLVLATEVIGTAH